VDAKYPLTQMVKATLSVYEELLRSTKILVIKLSAVGDVILASPSLRAIRAHYPHAHITCLVGSSSRPVVQRCPYVNEVFVDDASAHHKGYIGAWRLGRMLARHGFDVVFDLQSSRRSRLIGWSSGAAERHGYANTKWSFLLSHRVPNTEPHLPPVDHQFQLLEACGVRPMGDQLEYWHSDEDRQMITQFIKGQWMSTAQPMVALHPGASASWPTKQWSTNSWAALCDLLAKDHIRTVISGAPEDVALGEDILAMTRSKPIIAIGQTSLGSVAALFEQCQLVVTMDTAALHIAAAVSTPVVALFGPTDPRRHQPPGSAVHVLWKQVSCSPCYQRQCPLPDEQQMQCMQQIAVQDVFAAIQLHVRAAKDVSTEPVAPASHT
jgi:lipopolysaccharide heptosyltransferase II